MKLIEKWAITSLDYAKTLQAQKQKEYARVFRNITAYFNIKGPKVQKFLQLLLYLLGQKI